jgi:hypothetical protein
MKSWKNNLWIAIVRDSSNAIKHILIKMENICKILIFQLLPMDFMYNNDLIVVY